MPGTVIAPFLNKNSSAPLVPKPVASGKGQQVRVPGVTPLPSAPHPAVVAAPKGAQAPKAPVTLPKGVTVSPGVQRQLNFELPAGTHIKGATVAGLLTDAQKGLTSVVGGAFHGVDTARNAISHAIGIGGSGTGNGPGASSPIASVSPSQQVEAVTEKVAKGVARDAVAIPAETFPSLYYTGKAALQAAEGHPGELLQMGKQTLDQLTSPSGWENHALSNVLMLSGTGSALGRAAAFARGAAGLSDASVLARPDETLYGNASTPRLPYSKDPLIRAREKALDSIPTPAKRKVPGVGPRSFAQKAGRLVDDRYGTEATVWRNERNRITQDRVDAITSKRRPSGRQAVANLKDPHEPLLRSMIPGRDAVNLFAQGVLRHPDTVRQDLASTIRMVESHHYQQGSLEEHLQSETLGRLRALQNDKEFLKNPGAAYRAAHKFSKDMKPLQAGLVKRGYVSQEAVDHARLVPYAVTHIGVKHDVTEEALAHDAAKADLKKAQEQAKAAQRSVGKADGPAEGAAANTMLQAAQAKLEVARQLESGKAIAVDERKALVHPDGKRVTDEEIKAHMRAHRVNPDDVAFITHRQGTDAQARWTNFSRQALAETKQRTGEAFRGGLTDISHQAVVRQHLMSALISHRHDVIQRFLNKFALRKVGDGDFATHDQASRAATDPEFRTAHHVPEGVVLKPIRMAPQFSRKPQLTAIKAGLKHPEELFDEAAHTEVAQAHGYTPVENMVKAQESGQWALVPQDVLNRWMSHEQKTNQFFRAAQGAASLFRQSVLPFSSKRVVGLPQETLIRLGAGRAGLTSLKFAGRVTNTLNRFAEDEAQAPEFREAARSYLNQLTARALTGQQSSQALRMARYTPADYMAGTPMEGGVDLLAKAKGTPGPGHVLAAFKATTNGILKWQRHAIEGEASKAALGKALLLDFQQKTGYSWVKAIHLHQAAVDDFVKGLVHTDNQDMFGRYVDKMMGKWSNYSPLFTHIVALSPFLPWYTNSLRFLYATLPHDHPVVTGLLAAANAASTQQRAAVGESGPVSGNPNEVAGYEEGSVPLPGGDLLNLSYYSPFGAVTDPVGMIGQEALPPVIAPVVQSSLGFNSLWEYPKNASGQRVEPPWDQKLSMGFSSILGTIMPGFGAATEATSSPSNFTNLFRIYKPYPAQKPQSLDQQLGITNQQLGVSNSQLGVSNAQLGLGNIP